MKPKCTQQEILLVTSSTFMQSELCDKEDDKGNRPARSAREQLLEACWNGMLEEILPELFSEHTPDSKLFLWNIYEAESFIGIELGESEKKTDPVCSINPSIFLSSYVFN